jgi:hypothetical protein
VWGREVIKPLCDVYNLSTRFRLQLRFGTLSRAPLRLLRLEWRPAHIDCDWIARSNDEWDKDLSSRLSGVRASRQALEDAILVRELLFVTFPQISSATLRAFRQDSDEGPDLIIEGTVTRPEPSRWNVRSLVMQAKLCGFHFRLDNGTLTPLQVER